MLTYAALQGQGKRRKVPPTSGALQPEQNNNNNKNLLTYAALIVPPTSGALDTKRNRNKKDETRRFIYLRLENDGSFQPKNKL